MKEFASVIVTPVVREVVWRSMVFRMDDLARLMPTVEQTELISETEAGPACVRQVRRWAATPSVPDFIRPLLSSKNVVWLEHSSFDGTRHHCEWRIEHVQGMVHFSGSGKMDYEIAMGGRGTKLSIAGQVTIDRSGSQLFRNSGLGDIGEQFISNVITQNVREVVMNVTRLEEH